MELFRTIYPSEFYNKFLSQNVRPDGRSLLSVRKTSVSVGSITSAAGSSFVRLGHTSVVAGVKGEIGKPSLNNSQIGMICFIVLIIMIKVLSYLMDEN
jgi:exosome complex component RRP43